MEVRIGVQHSPREVVLESTETPAKISKAVADAIANDSLLSLTDDKGRTIVVPGNKIAFVEIGVQSTGRVGFATGSN
ncbi:MAG: DUF3107 domain-containing protein [Actinomycetes bacterium]